jgi:hypothetical protein
LAVFGILHVIDTARSQLMAAVVDGFYPSNADDANRIVAVALFDAVSVSDSIDDWKECDGDFVETREGDWESAEVSTSDDTAAMIWILLTIFSLERTGRSGVR